MIIDNFTQPREIKSSAKSPERNIQIQKNSSKHVYRQQKKRIPETDIYLEALVKISPVLASRTSQSRRIPFFPDAETHVST